MSDKEPLVAPNELTVAEAQAASLANPDHPGYVVNSEQNIVRARAPQDRAQDNRRMLAVGIMGPTLSRGPQANLEQGKMLSIDRDVTTRALGELSLNIPGNDDDDDDDFDPGDATTWETPSKELKEGMKAHYGDSATPTGVWKLDRDAHNNLVNTLLGKDFRDNPPKNSIRNYVTYDIDQKNQDGTPGTGPGFFEFSTADPKTSGNEGRFKWFTRGTQRVQEDAWWSFRKNSNGQRTPVPLGDPSDALGENLTSNALEQPFKGFD
jgi:hypothetical protein